MAPAGPSSFETRARARSSDDGLEITLLPRHHWRALIARLDPIRCRREIQRRAASVGAAAGHQQPVLTGHEIALAQRRVILDLDRGQPDRVLAVAGASGNELVA